MKDYLIDNNLNLDSTIIFQGVGVNESDMRFKAGLHIVSNGLLYHFNYQKMKAQCCSRLMMLQNHVKKKLLLEFTTKYNIDYPVVTGCTFCPIFLKVVGTYIQTLNHNIQIISCFKILF